MPSQAQKHVTPNEALRKLDAIVQISVQNRTTSTPPVTPDEGVRYIAADGAADAWSGRDGEIAMFQDGTWTFHTPQAGWLAWIEDEQLLLAFDGET